MNKYTLSSRIDAIRPSAPPALTVEAPLIRTDMVQAILGINQSAVAYGLRFCCFPYVWDFTVQRNERRFGQYRFLTASIAALQPDSKVVTPASYDEAEKMIVPSEPINWPQLLTLFSASERFMASLSKSGHFPRSKGRKGRSPPACIPPKLIADFLRSRRVL